MKLGELVTLTSYLVGIVVFLVAAHRRRVATDGMSTVMMVGVTSGLIGAKLTELVVLGWPVRIPVEAALNPQLGGRALLGGIAFGWLGVEVAKARMGIRSSTGDLFALALPAGEAVGRIGCYLNECCYGIPSHVPWAVWQHGTLRHPTQLYSAIVALGTFGFLIWLWPRTKVESTLFRTYLSIFAVSRFGLEFLRWRDSTVIGLSLVQWVCLIVLVWLLLRKKQLTEVASI